MQENNFAREYAIEQIIIDLSDGSENDDDFFFT